LEREQIERIDATVFKFATRENSPVNAAVEMSETANMEETAATVPSPVEERSSVAQRNSVFSFISSRGTARISEKLIGSSRPPPIVIPAKTPPPEPTESIIDAELPPELLNVVSGMEVINDSVDLPGEFETQETWGALPSFAAAAQYEQEQSFTSDKAKTERDYAREHYRNHLKEQEKRALEQERIAQFREEQRGLYEREKCLRSREAESSGSDFDSDVDYESENETSGARPRRRKREAGNGNIFDRLAKPTAVKVEVKRKTAGASEKAKRWK
jgi:hypothetical protein